jgi:hypothetical protein
VSPSPRGLWGRDALLISTGAAGYTNRHPFDQKGFAVQRRASHRTGRECMCAPTRKTHKSPDLVWLGSGEVQTP